MVGKSPLLRLVKYQFARIDSSEDSVARAITAWHDTTIGELRYLLSRRRNEGYQTANSNRSKSHTDKRNASVSLSRLSSRPNSVSRGLGLRSRYTRRRKT